MIFYFTGTGNSLAAAKHLQRELGEHLLSISELVKKREFSFELEPGEKVGFVFPVYFSGLPSIVAHFINHLEIASWTQPYTFAVLTCGGSIGGAGELLKDCLGRRGITLDRMYSLVMPENYVPVFKVPSKDRQQSILETAEEKLEMISQHILEEKKEDITAPLGQLATVLMYPWYKKGRRTEKFHVTDACVGCKRCQMNCPVDAIKVTKGKPVWVKERCVLCLSCLHGCPVEAIEYGKRTKNKGRYQHPDFSSFVN